MNLLPTVPTDNIYKFYALFGLALFITGVVTMVTLHNSFSEQAALRFVEIEAMKAIVQPTPEQVARLTVLNRQDESASGERNFYHRLLAYLFAVSIGATIYGFAVWHRKIQPVQSAIAEQQLEKLKLENAALRRAAERAIADA